MLYFKPYNKSVQYSHTYHGDVYLRQKSSLYLKISTFQIADVVHIPQLSYLDSIAFVIAVRQVQSVITATRIVVLYLAVYLQKVPTLRLPHWNKILQSTELFIYLYDYVSSEKIFYKNIYEMFNTVLRRT